MKSVLNIGAGDFGYPRAQDINGETIDDLSFIIDLDVGFNLNVTSLHQILYSQERWFNNTKDVINHYRSNVKAEDFLEEYPILFDEVIMWRFLEHIPKKDLLYFIYLLSTKVKIGGKLDIIVPDFKELSKRILNEDVNHPDFEKDDMITTYELLNEQPYPHLSIWTENRAKKYLEFERRFEVTKIVNRFRFDGCNIYLKIIAERVDGR